MSTPRSDELLFAAGGDVWEKYGTFVKRTLPEEERGSFSRSSDATFRDLSEVLRTAESGVLRPHYVSSESSYSARLEAARTNSILHSEDFSDAAWDKVNSATVTADDAVGPDGATTADLVEDPNSSGFGLVAQTLTLTVSDDTLKRAGAVFIRKESSFDTAVEVILRYDGGGTLTEYIVQLNPATGDFDTSRGATPTRADVEDYNSDWWRVWVVGPNTGDGNTNVDLRVIPAINSSGADGSTDASATGSCHAWGAQLEGLSGGASFPSSYVQTTSSAVSRAADDLSSPISFEPQPMTMYVKVLNRAAMSLTTALAEMGAGNNVHFALRRVNSEYRVRYDDDSGSSTASFTTSSDIGDVVELVGAVHPDGHVSGELSLNGGAVESVEKTTQLDLSVSWSDDRIGINSQTDGNITGLADFISGPIIAPGVRTMDECRSIEV